MNTSALLHMICQQSNLNSRNGVGAGSVARWMDATKPTALKRLYRLSDLGHLEIRQSQWRSNAIMYWFVPSISTLKKFARGEFKSEYDLEMARRTNHLVNYNQGKLF